MGRPRQRRRSKRQEGFSRPGQRQAWNPITRGASLRGREKRQFFNQISGIMVVSAGVAGAFFGISLLGWVGAVIGFVVAAVLMGQFVVRGRYFR